MRISGYKINNDFSLPPWHLMLLLYRLSKWSLIFLIFPSAFLPLSMHKIIQGRKKIVTRIIFFLNNNVFSIRRYVKGIPLFFIRVIPFIKVLRIYPFQTWHVQQLFAIYLFSLYNPRYHDLIRLVSQKLFIVSNSIIVLCFSLRICENDESKIRRQEFCLFNVIMMILFPNYSAICFTEYHKF